MLYQTWGPRQRKKGLFSSMFLSFHTIVSAVSSVNIKNILFSWENYPGLERHSFPQFGGNQDCVLRNCLHSWEMAPIRAARRASARGDPSSGQGTIRNWRGGRWGDGFFSVLDFHLFGLWLKGKIIWFQNVNPLDFTMPPDLIFKISFLPDNL